MNANVQADQYSNSVMAGGPPASLRNPSFLIECGYFFTLFYAFFGDALGLAFPMVGAGLLGGLALMCLMHFGTYSMGAFRPLRFAFGCAISFLLIQVLVFEESLKNSQMRGYITWILSLIIIQTLSFRKGFFLRFGIVAFLMGCATLPFLKVYVATDEMMRIGGESGVALKNPNYFGMWFGFCSVFFIVTGLEARNYLIRMSSWLAGIFCLYLMALTVSRGSLLGVAIATVIAFQKVLKRSFLPILGFLIFVWIIFISGVFDDLIGYYLHRGTEETGRSKLWKWAFSGFLDSWWSGVGVSHAKVIDANTGNRYGPHNALLFFGYSSGIVPLGLFILYLAQATRGALRARTQSEYDSPYKLPLVSFALLTIMVADENFMSPWHLVVFCAAIATARYPKKSKRSLKSPSMVKISRSRSTVSSS